MEFTKMEGCGNDYIYVDGGKWKIPEGKKPKLVQFLSDRHFGIGGDGVIFINPAAEADFEMEMYNADGSRSEMCGNGIRCVAKYVYDKGLTDLENISIVSAGKIKYLELTVEKTAENPRGEVRFVRVNMGAPILQAREIPVALDMDEVVAQPITVQDQTYQMTCVSMGNPHAVVFVDSTADFPLEKVGPDFEHHPLFPKRTNTEFVQVLNSKEINMRVWERGTGETLACGTGSCGSVVACILNKLTEDSVLVHLLGGDLKITWDRTENLVYMEGPATTVFDGEINIDRFL